MEKNYQMRRAAGINWLLDMGQEGYPDYRKPIPLNDSGAHLWELLRKNMSIDEIADKLSREQDIERDVARRDIEEFVGQLKNRGVR